MYFYSIIFGFLLCTFVFSDEEFDKDVKEVTLSEEISKLKMITHLITEVEAYNKMIDELNESYDLKVMEGMDKIRLDYENGLLKRNLFNIYFQCSQASFAFQYLSSTEKIILKKKINTEEREHLNYISMRINDVVLKLMAILFHIKFSPPKWMVMLNIFCEDLIEKSMSEKYKENIFLEHLNNYVRADIRNIIDTIQKFLVQCDINLKPNYLGSYSIFKTDDPVKDHNAFNDRLYEFNEKMKISTDVLDHKYHESFKSDQWLFRKTFSDSQIFFLPNAEKEGIFWNKIDETFIADVNQFFSDNTKKNAVLELYRSAQKMIDIQNFIKNIYQIVVLRFVYVGAILCDNMGTQILETGVSSEMEKIFIEKCTPMIKIIDDAIEFLGGDEFLESLRPLVEEYIKSPSDRVSSIQLKTLGRLNHLCSLMGVDAIDAVEPQFEKTEILGETNPSAANLFQWVSSFFQNAIKYTENIKTAIPFLNFKVVEYIQNSTNNKWIHHAEP